MEPRNHSGVIAFYYPGWEQVWDKMFGSAFLGNCFDLGQDELVLRPPRGREHRFRNAEAAFQALKFWKHAGGFGDLSGTQALRMKQMLMHSMGVDLSYSGFGSNWQAMLAVLRAKFQPDSLMEDLLLRTGDAFLLEHNAVSGRDKIWSDNGDGSGQNWLGLQLMLVRDELRPPGSPKEWTRWITSCVDVNTGSAKKAVSWQNAVRAATRVVCEAIDEEEAHMWWRAEEEAKRRAQEEAKRRAEEEAKRRAEEEAKRRADEEAKRAEEAKAKGAEEATHKEEAKRAEDSHHQGFAANSRTLVPSKEVPQDTPERQPVHADSEVQDTPQQQPAEADSEVEGWNIIQPDERGVSAAAAAAEADSGAEDGNCQPREDAIQNPTAAAGETCSKDETPPQEDTLLGDRSIVTVD